MYKKISLQWFEENGKKSGSWFSYGDKRIGQGRENAKSFLEENPEILQSIDKAVRENKGFLSGNALPVLAELPVEEAE